MFHDVQSLNHELKALAGSFAPAGTAAPNGLAGVGFTVARTAQGVFRVTLADKYNQVVAVGANIQLATPAVRSVLVGAIDTAASTIILTVVDGAAAAQDVAADANNRINFIAWLRNSTIR